MAEVDGGSLKNKEKILKAAVLNFGMPVWSLLLNAGGAFI